MPVLSALDTPKGENYMPESKDYEIMQDSVSALGFAVSAFPWGRKTTNRCWISAKGQGRRGRDACDIQYPKHHDISRMCLSPVMAEWER